MLVITQRVDKFLQMVSKIQLGNKSIVAHTNIDISKLIR